MRPPGALFLRLMRIGFAAMLAAWICVGFWNCVKPLPSGTHVASLTMRISESDLEWLLDAPPRDAPPRDAPPRRAAATAALTAIDNAEQMVVLEQSPVVRDVAQHLLNRKHARPNLQAVLITDPADEAYGGSHAQYLAAMEGVGVIVARVRLDRLRDSNPVYSGLWRLCCRWWSDPSEDPLRVLPAWLRQLNFKSNQRRVLIADDGAGGWISIVGSNAHSAVLLRGAIARELAGSALQIAGWSVNDDRLPAAPPTAGRGIGSVDVRFLTEGAIQIALLEALRAASSGDKIFIGVENLSDRGLIRAALDAAGRGASLQVALAAARLPNQAAAAELMNKGGGRVQVRWNPADSTNVQMHMLLVRHRSDLLVNWSSANFTRRNLGDLNLQAGVELRMPERSVPARTISDYVVGVWSRAAPYATFADESAGLYWRYRFAEATGFSSF